MTTPTPSPPPRRHCQDHSGLETEIRGLREDVAELKVDSKSMRKTLNLWMGGLAVLVFLLQILPKIISSAQAAIGG